MSIKGFTIFDHDDDPMASSRQSPFVEDLQVEFQEPHSLDPLRWSFLIVIRIRTRVLCHSTDQILEESFEVGRIGWCQGHGHVRRLL